VTEALHPAKRYRDAALRAVGLLQRLQDLFHAHGMDVFVEYCPADSFEVCWNPHQKSFGWRTRGPAPEHLRGQKDWHPVTADLRAAGMNRYALDRVANLMCVIPSLYDEAKRRRDQLADDLDTMSYGAEAFLDEKAPTPHMREDDTRLAVEPRLQPEVDPSMVLPKGLMAVAPELAGMGFVIGDASIPEPQEPT
jgi:hypothetical protein